MLFVRGDGVILVCNIDPPLLDCRLIYTPFSPDVLGFPAIANIIYIGRAFRSFFSYFSVFTAYGYNRALYIFCPTHLVILKPISSPIAQIHARYFSGSRSHHVLNHYFTARI